MTFPGELTTFTTPLTRCAVCKGSLTKHHEVSAVLVSFQGLREVTHQMMKCTDKKCRAQHGQNYVWVDKQKINTVGPTDIEVLFINAKCAFDMKFLEYHEALQFRGFLSTRAIAWAAGDALFDGEEIDHWRLRCEDARFLRLAMLEFSDLDKAGGEKFLQQIALSHDSNCQEISDSALAAYDKWLHMKVFPPPKPQTVTTLAGDGHEKVLTKICAGDRAPMKSPKAPGGGRKPFLNGWFGVVSPKDGRILSMVQQFEPENNAVVTEALEKIIEIYPKANCFVMDRNCKYAPTVMSRKKLKVIKTWAIDKFHGKHHSATCKCSPYNHASIMRRLSGVNTSVCEQVWSWFR